MSKSIKLLFVLVVLVLVVCFVRSFNQRQTTIPVPVSTDTDAVKNVISYRIADMEVKYPESLKISQEFPGGVTLTSSVSTDNEASGDSQIYLVQIESRKYNDSQGKIFAQGKFNTYTIETASTTYSNFHSASLENSQIVVNGIPMVKTSLKDLYLAYSFYRGDTNYLIYTEYSDKPKAMSDLNQIVSSIRF